jgi:hypothetical protein
LNTVIEQKHNRRENNVYTTSTTPSWHTIILKVIAMVIKPEMYVSIHPGGRHHLRF